MSLFEKDELRKLLAETKAELLERGEDEKSAEKLTRREFVKWLGGYTQDLRREIRSVDALDPAGRKARVERARTDFDFFRRTYFPHYYYLPGKSELQAHLETVYMRIAAKERVRRSATGTAASAAIASEKHALAAPRGHGKSTDASVVFPIWLVAYDLKRFITIFSDAVELTETLIETIKAELEENENLAADFPEMCGASTVRWRIGDINTRNGVRIKGYGSSKRVRGVKNGTHRPDQTIIDDLENDENVRSREQRKKLENWLDEAVANLGAVNDVMDILYIGTILHRDSVLARKLKLKFWNPMIFRAIITFPVRMDLWDRFGHLYRNMGIEDAHTFYVEHKADMDVGATVLWPEAVPLETLMRKRAEGKRAFDKELQNNPNSDTQKFGRDRMKFYKSPPRKLTYYGWCDPSEGVQGGDYANFTVLGVDEKAGIGYVIESINEIMSSTKIVSTIVDLHLRFRFKKFGFEKNGGAAHLIPYIKKEAHQRGVILQLKAVHNSDTKEFRIEELELPVETGDLLLHPAHTILIEQLEDFPEGDHDDAPDGLSGAYRLSKLSKQKQHSQKRTNYRGAGSARRRHR